MFRIVQLSHDILTNRVSVGIQGPTAADFISLNCALPEGSSKAVRSLATAEAARLLAAAAQGLLRGDGAGLAAHSARFTCECCGVAAQLPGDAGQDSDDRQPV